MPKRPEPAARCPVCDLPPAVMNRHREDCGCPLCTKRCWAAYGSSCVPVDWRARALAAEARLATEQAACDRYRVDHVVAGQSSICQTWPSRDVRCPLCREHDARRERKTDAANAEATAPLRKQEP